MKQLKCRDAGFDCDAVVEGETTEQVLAQAGPHAKEAHGVDVTPDMAEPSPERFETSSQSVAVTASQAHFPNRTGTFR